MIWKTEQGIKPWRSEIFIARGGIFIADEFTPKVNKFL
jgi:hypothetical protein